MHQLILHTRQGVYEIAATPGELIVKLTKKQKIPWGYSCERGICAQCRTKVLAGAEWLNEVTEAEKKRLRKAERQEGFRLGCQIQLTAPGDVELAHQPY